MKLYAVPYAGGHSLVYRPLQGLLNGKMEWVTLELPGRGRRAKEPLLTDMERLADDLFTAIRGELNDSDYALFGHSMGSLLVYLLAQRIVAAGLPLPRRLFCSGRGAPSVRGESFKPQEEPKHTLSKAAFWDYIDSLGGVPPELKQHQELMDYFEPVLRADIAGLENYRYRPTQPLDIPITVLYGVDDTELHPQGMLAWQQESRHAVEIYPLHGGHFSIFDPLQLPWLVALLQRQLLTALS